MQCVAPPRPTNHIRAAASTCAALCFIVLQCVAVFCSVTVVLARCVEFIVKIGLKKPTLLHSFSCLMQKKYLYSWTVACDWLQSKYQNVKPHTSVKSQVFWIRILLWLYLNKGGCLHGEDMDITHRRQPQNTNNSCGGGHLTWASKDAGSATPAC